MVQVQVQVQSGSEKRDLEDRIVHSTMFQIASPTPSVLPAWPLKGLSQSSAIPLSILSKLLQPLETTGFASSQLPFAETVSLSKT